MAVTADSTLVAYRRRLDAYHAWRLDSPLIAKLGLMVLFAGLMGLLAQVRIPLPFTPVPITGQVFGVLLAAALLGGRWGAGSQMLYVGAGAAGIPWYANMTGGMGVLTGVTGGYLAGFVIATAILGFAFERHPTMRRFGPMVALMLGAVAVVHLFGAAWLGFVLGVGVRESFLLGSAPFLALDAVKAVAAAGLGVAIVRR